MDAHRRHYLTLAMGALGAFTAQGALGQTPPPPKRKPDLGDAVEGKYAGDVISDSKGSSRSGVNLTVTRIGPNQVRVTSDYARLPEITVTLTRAMDKILAARGDSTFLYDPAKRPAGLDVSFHQEVSWSGSKQ